MTPTPRGPCLALVLAGTAERVFADKDVVVTVTDDTEAVGTT